MTLGRAEATLIADVIDAQQRALGRALTRSEMDNALKIAADTAVDAMRCAETNAYEEWKESQRARQRAYYSPEQVEASKRAAADENVQAECSPPISPALHDKTWCRCAACAAWRRKFVTARWL